VIDNDVYPLLGAEAIQEMQLIKISISQHMPRGQLWLFVNA
jgi:hypothetical protein